jgi:hypothetical protein
MDTEPFREYVWCHYCYSWGDEDQFSVTNMIFGGVIRQVLYHTPRDFFDTGPLTHMANWRRDLE